MSTACVAAAQGTVPLLVVSADDEVHSSLHHILRSDCRLHRAGGRGDAVSLVRKYRPKVVICDQTLADGDWRDFLMDLEDEEQAPPLIVSSRLADDRLWAEVLNLGAFDLLTKPFTASEVSRVVQMAARAAGDTR
jgi:DNA-binding response OmpR family regulator